MSHADLIQAATDLLSESRNPDFWLARYDAALASGRDGQLKRLVKSLLAERSSTPLPIQRLPTQTPASRRHRATRLLKLSSVC
jgi:hypothetical protein